MTAAVASLLFVVVSTRAAERLSRAELIEDVRQLGRVIEDVHPDPYARGGGKIAFHRRLQETLADIPMEGMSVEDFYRLLRPLVASVGDAHTWLRDPDEIDREPPGGIPLYFDVVDGGLYVLAVTGEAFRDLIGARLVSVEGVPLVELVRRQGRRMGSENDYLLLRNLGRGGALWQRFFLEDLLPEWKDRSRVSVELDLATGRRETRTLEIPTRMDYSAFVHPQSRLALPGLRAALQKSDFAYDFVDPARKTCLLTVNGMSGYREAFEGSLGREGAVPGEDAREAYRRFHGTEPPTAPSELLRGIPSATELFTKMAQEMKSAGTENLLVDLRRNDGGNSAMYNILIYVLYGRDKLLDLKGHRLEIRRLSRTYLDVTGNSLLDEINRDRAVPLAPGDYDFRQDYPHLGYPGREAIAREFETFAATMPTFSAEWKSGKFSGYYLPRRIFVLSSDDTFSSGFTLLYYLHRAGAKVVGTPPSQGGNCYGDTVDFTLQHSGLGFIVSHKYFEYYPDDPETGRLLRPDYPLTYERLAGYDFDPRATILYALDIIRGEEAAD